MTTNMTFSLCKTPDELKEASGINHHKTWVWLITVWRMLLFRPEKNWTFSHFHFYPGYFSSESESLHCVLLFWEPRDFLTFCVWMNVMLITPCWVIWYLMLVHFMKELHGRNSPCREKTKQWSLAEDETVKKNNIEYMQDYYTHSSTSEIHVDRDFKITQDGSLLCWWTLACASNVELVSPKQLRIESHI